VGVPRAGHRPALKYVLANWKMYPTVDEARDRLLAMQAGLLAREAEERPRVVVCPPFVALPALRAVADREVVALGAQTCHWEQEGPYTGEVSPRMLRGLADYVMVGHSERRAAGETDDQVARKVAAVVDAGLVPILFVGEDEPGDDAPRVTEGRLRKGLSGIDPETSAVLVVYEPAWAIGADRAAPPDHVRSGVGHVKSVMAELGVAEPEVLYGGTVAEENVGQLAALAALDGVGATRSSLDPERFLRLVEAVAGGAHR
jgi:triosephosphate isomerase (TIM)